MRGIISFVIALCLTAFGAFGLIYFMLFATGWRGWMVISAGLIFALGVVWLYSEYSDATPKEPQLVSRRTADIIRKCAEHLGIVEVKDEAEAIKKAAEMNDIPPEHRNRITVRQVKREKG